MQQDDIKANVENLLRMTDSAASEARISLEAWQMKELLTSWLALYQTIHNLQTDQRPKGYYDTVTMHVGDACIVDSNVPVVIVPMPQRTPEEQNAMKYEHLPSLPVRLPDPPSTDIVK